jgi:ATP/maltotriose-dependent transcriptional regulator MalT/DNA-binding SARP family transcriptional activator
MPDAQIPRSSLDGRGARPDGSDAGGHVNRPDLTRAIAAGAQRRLLLVVAGAGYGKTSALAEWAASEAPAWIAVQPRDRGLGGMARALAGALDRPLPGLAADLLSVVAAWRPGADPSEASTALADLISEALEDRGDPAVTLVVDDAQELGVDDPAWRLLEALVRRAPPGFHLVLSSRTAPALVVERLRGRGDVADVGPAALRFDRDAVARVLAIHGLGDDGALAESLLHITRGRPVSVHLAAETLSKADPADRPAILARVIEPGRPLGDYLAAEVLASESSDAVRLIGCAATVGHVDALLGVALGVPDAAEMLTDLARRGVSAEDPPGSGRHTVAPSIADVARRRLGSDAVDALRARAIEAMDASGRRADAMSALLDTPRTATRDEAIRSLLRRSSLEMVTPENANVFAAASAAVTDDGDADLERVRAEALRASGDWDGALATFQHLAPGGGPLDPALAWRWGLMLYLLGQSADALSVLERASLRAGCVADDAQTMAWLSTLHWSRGEIDKARDLASEAIAAGRRSGDAAAIAAARTALALVAASDGDRDRNHREYLAALVAAERARDVVQQVRIHSNLSSKWLEEGRAADAISEAEAALRLGRGMPAFAAVAHCNRAEALLRLGRLDEARAGFETAREAYATLGSRLVSVPLSMLGDLHRERGDLVRARAAYDQARTLAERAHDVHSLVPAQCGLARVIASEESEEAIRLVDEAIRRSDGLTRPGAHCAAGWIAIVAGNREAARGHAAAALDAARTVTDRAALAEALELDAMSGGPVSARLDEAISLWREMANPIGEARARLARALLVDSGRRVVEASQARSALAQMGIREQPAAAGILAALAQRMPGLQVRTLGAFRVLRDGETIPLSTWQSRKARDLLKLLVTARGRPVPRERLAENLWPDEDPARVGNRLSVALSILRTVVDPGRRQPSDHFIRGDKQAISIDLEHVDVDVVALLGNAADGQRRAAVGDWVAAVPLLRAVEEGYGGDFLEEDAYEDWTAQCREEVRAAALEASRTLARHATASGDDGAAVVHLRRQLERDPFDEEASLALVEALLRLRRQGEARRVYDAYSRRMAELGVEPERLPAVSRG